MVLLNPNQFILKLKINNKKGGFYEKHIIDNTIRGFSDFI
jgi:hypothetical protein